MPDKWKTQRGNALSEFVVIAGILVPALLSLPILAKLADARHTSVQANRYAVWEKTVGGRAAKSDEQISAEVQARFFSDPATSIVSGGEQVSTANPYWSFADAEQGSKAIVGGTALIRSYNRDIPGDVGAEYIAAAMAEIGAVMDGPIKDAKWDVQDKGFYMVNLQMEIGTHPLVETGVNCEGVESDAAAGCLSIVGAIFTDEWDAASSDQAASRARSMVPAGAMNEVMNVVSYIGAIPLFKELKHLKDAFGTVNPDVLPADRYGDLQ